MKGKWTGKWGMIGSMMALISLLLLTMGAHQKSTGLYLSLDAVAEFELLFHGSGRLDRIEAKNAAAKVILSNLELGDDQAESVLDALLDGLKNGGQLAVAEEIVVGIAAKDASKPLAEKVKTHLKGTLAAMAQTERLRLVEFPWTSETENRARAANVSMTELVRRDRASGFAQEMAVESPETGTKPDESPERGPSASPETEAPAKERVTPSPSGKAETPMPVLRSTANEVRDRQTGSRSKGDESPVQESPDGESPETESPDTESPDYESPDTESPDF